MMPVFKPRRVNRVLERSDAYREKLRDNVTRNIDKVLVRADACRTSTDNVLDSIWLFTRIETVNWRATRPR